MRCCDTGSKRLYTRVFCKGLHDVDSLGGTPEKRSLRSFNNFETTPCEQRAPLTHKGIRADHDFFLSPHSVLFPEHIRESRGRSKTFLPCPYSIQDASCCEFFFSRNYCHAFSSMSNKGRCPASSCCARVGKTERTHLPISARIRERHTYTDPVIATSQEKWQPPTTGHRRVSRSCFFGHFAS